MTVLKYTFSNVNSIKKIVLKFRDQFHIYIHSTINPTTKSQTGKDGEKKRKKERLN